MCNIPGAVEGKKKRGKIPTLYLLPTSQCGEEEKRRGGVKGKKGGGKEVRVHPNIAEYFPSSRWIWLIRKKRRRRGAVLSELLRTEIP